MHWISSNSMCKVEYLLRLPDAYMMMIRYDVILDATDNVATRYLLNDACVLAGKPLVSGSALRMDGQVIYLANDLVSCTLLTNDTISSQCTIIMVVLAIVVYILYLLPLKR